MIKYLEVVHEIDTPFENNRDIIAEIFASINSTLSDLHIDKDKIINIEIIYPPTFQKIICLALIIYKEDTWAIEK